MSHINQLKTTQMKTKVTYKAKGLILGNMWGGGKGSYPSKEVFAESKEELDQLINNQLIDGTLDSGGGFDGLVGAVMDITITTNKTIHGRIFSNKEHDMGVYGNLTEEQTDNLCEQYYSML